MYYSIITINHRHFETHSYHQAITELITNNEQILLMTYFILVLTMQLTPNNGIAIITKHRGSK